MGTPVRVLRGKLVDCAALAEVKVPEAGRPVGNLPEVAVGDVVFDLWGAMVGLQLWMCLKSLLVRFRCKFGDTQVRVKGVVGSVVDENEREGLEKSLNVSLYGPCPQAPGHRHFVFFGCLA